MSKKAKFKKNLDPFTSANDIQQGLSKDKKKNKRTPAEINRRERHHQKEIVRQLTEDLVKISEKDILEDNYRENPHHKKNEVIYTIRPVKSKEE